MNLIWRIFIAVGAVALGLSVVFLVLAFPLLSNRQNFELFMPMAIGCLGVVVILANVATVYFAIRFAITGKDIF